MRRKLFLFGLVILSFILGYLHDRVTISKPEEIFKEYRQDIYFTNSEAQLKINLTKEAHLLKLKHVIQENQSKEFFVNGEKFYPSILNNIKRRGIIETNWVYIPKKYVKDGENLISIVFRGNHPPDVNITLSNYRRRIGNDLFVLFIDSLPTKTQKDVFALLAPIIFVLCFGSLIYVGNFLFGVSLNKLFLLQLYSILPFLIFLIGSTFNYYIYRIKISSSYFWKFGLVSFFLMQTCIVFLKLLRLHKLGLLSASTAADSKNGFTINEKWINRADKLSFFIHNKIRWLYYSKLADKVIIIFFVSMVLAALFLILHINVFAEFLAYIGYFSMVIGLSIKFAKFVKEGDNE